MDYPPRVGKSERIYKLWETGEGDMGELAIGLYDLTAHFKVLWDEHEALKQERDALVCWIKCEAEAHRQFNISPSREEFEIAKAEMHKAWLEISEETRKEVEAE